MNDPEVRTVTYEVHKVPTRTIVVPDWDTVYERVKAGDERVYECTLDQRAAFVNWAKRKHGHYMFYRTVAPGLLQFTLEKQRGEPKPTKSLNKRTSA
jgi:hypothetical protein